ncbi:MAG: hypothetical protein ACJAT7_003386 [Psychromonas sp.]|jgi:hypothetical protein|uniref:hypothetical protein n=1 Tax=Psychromonas sp. TaxID=1884585 RepID=UPI0039E26285
MLLQTPFLGNTANKLIKVIRKKGLLISPYIKDDYMTKINKKSEFSTLKKTKNNNQDWKLELFALFGFCISGTIFVLSGIQNGDFLTIIGSSVWIFSCVIWMIPYRKYFYHSNDKADRKYPYKTN